MLHAQPQLQQAAHEEPAVEMRIFAYVPTVIAARGLTVVIVNPPPAAGPMITVKLFVAVLFFESVTRIANVYVPAAVGVPYKYV
jgi:hypothetical protein